MISQKLNFTGLLLAFCLWSAACSHLDSNPGDAGCLFPPEEITWSGPSPLIEGEGAALAQGEDREELISNLVLSDLLVPKALDISDVSQGRIMVANASRKMPFSGEIAERSPITRRRPQTLEAPKALETPKSPETPRPDYRLGLGDGLELIFQYSHDPKSGEYRFRIKDQIGLSFLNFPDYNRALMVREDGKIDLPLVGEITAAGQTLEEIRKVIEKAYADQEESPQIDLYTISYTTREEELYGALLNAQLGPARRVVVRPDGYISVPLIGDIRAIGRTAEELRSSILNSYKAKGLSNMSVSLLVLSTPSSVAYVMGEVRQQGPIALRGPLDAWRAIAQAGGFTPDADRSRVVVTKTADGVDRRVEINFNAWSEGEGFGENIVINQGDLIYVSKVSDRYIYISGEVKVPGRIDLDVDSRITVSQAVAMGGGVTDRAVRDKVMLLRKSDDSQGPSIIEVDLKAIRKMSKKDLAEEGLSGLMDPLMKPGDIVHVPVSTAGKANWFAKRWFADVIWTILPFTSSASYSYQSGSVKSNP